MYAYISTEFTHVLQSSFFPVTFTSNVIKHVGSSQNAMQTCIIFAKCDNSAN